jgi:thiamine biosynthesis protein ThiI
VTILLLRYSEIGLKSDPVRKRFENQLRENIMAMLAKDGVEAFVTKKGARIFIETDDSEKAIRSARKVFGVASMSVAETCSSDMEDICRTAAAYSKGRLSQGQTFAVDARRDGSHPYTSIDVAREAGSAIFLENESLGIKVKLKNPDVTFFVEVRDNMAYIFQEVIQCHSGLPIGTQGKVVADVEDDRGLVSAWLAMKRGCRIIFRGPGDFETLRNYDPEMRMADDKNVRYALAYIQGKGISDLEDFDASKYDLPVFFPTVAMSDEEVGDLAAKIRAGFRLQRMRGLVTIAPIRF